MHLLHLDWLRSSLLDLPNGCLAEEPSVGILLAREVLVGTRAMEYWYQRDQRRWLRVVEDPDGAHDERAFEKLLRGLFGAQRLEQVAVVTPTTRKLPQISRALRATDRQLVGVTGPTEFWCAALGLPAGTYGFLQGGYRASRCLIVVWNETAAEVVAESALPALGRDALQGAIEPIVRKTIQESAGLDPLADPYLARTFYGILHSLCDRLCTSAEDLHFSWGTDNLCCPTELVRCAIEDLMAQGDGQLEQCLGSLRVKPAELFLTPSARMASAWGSRSKVSRTLREVTFAGIDAVGESRVQAVLCPYHAELDEVTLAPPLAPTGRLRAFALAGLLVLLFAGRAMWLLVTGTERRNGERSPTSASPSGPRAPGIYLRTGVAAGERISSSALEVLPGGTGSDWPSELLHVEGGFALHDLQSGERLNWEDVSPESTDTTQ